MTRTPIERMPAEGMLTRTLIERMLADGMLIGTLIGTERQASRRIFGTTPGRTAAPPTVTRNMTPPLAGPVFWKRSDSGHI